MKIRAVIVDDEAPARTRLRQLLRDESDFEIVAECANGREAMEAIRKEKPALVFMDIQMPGLSGMDVALSVEAEPHPLIVFVTAYTQFAVQAFEVHAVDYLLKPFDRERFQKTLCQVRQRLGDGKSGISKEELLAILADFKSGSAHGERLAFKSDGRVVFVKVSEIEWAQSDGNYLELARAGQKYRLRETLQWLEDQLPEDRFLRIGRSALVNVDFVREVQPMFYGDQVVIMKDGAKLGLSRKYKAGLEKFLERKP